MQFTRSEYAGEEPRQQVNLITSFLDGSVVYGSDAERANNLRTMTDGLMKTSDNGRMLPYNEYGEENAGGNHETYLFLAGDLRANEQAALTAMHTLFVREHNRLAGLVKLHHPDADDETIYQLARKMVGATIQIITYKEFLPALLGSHAPDPDDYSGYDASYNPSIANEFSTFAYRFGHSMLSSSLKLADDNGAFGSVMLRDLFFNPGFFTTNGQVDHLKVDHLILGLLQQAAQEVDTMVVDDVRNFLFSTPNGEGSCLDLASLNIHRGRDHGTLTCNTMREQMGMPPLSFSELTMDEDLGGRLSDAYNGEVNDLDAWVCGLAEKHLPDASVGELLAYIIKDQFTRLMVGDPFFYKWDADLNNKKLANIWNENQVTLANVIRENTISDISPQANVFFV